MDNTPKAVIEPDDQNECWQMYSEDPICDHDGDGSRQHIATIYDHEEAKKILVAWNREAYSASKHDYKWVQQDALSRQHLKLDQVANQRAQDRQDREVLCRLQAARIEQARRNCEVLYKLLTGCGVGKNDASEMLGEEEVKQAREALVANFAILQDEHVTV